VLHLHFSNRHEILAERLGDALAASTAGVFDRERVLVPSAAWQRWLSLHLARRLGVCTQVEFGFLAPWLWRQLPGEHPLRSPPPDTEVLAWRTWAWLAQPDTLAAHPRLARWLAAHGGADAPAEGDHASGSNALARWELAQDAARQIEQIETWRPRWIEAWRHGRSALASLPGATALHRADEAWQAALWRHLRADAPSPGAEPSARATADGPSLPVHLFAPPSVPPLHLAALRELARRHEIHVYLANPCREYWFDLVSPRRLSHLRLRGRDAAHEVGHGLLMRWGAAAQAQMAAWNEAVGEDGALDDGDYVSNTELAAATGASPTPSLLAQVQDGLLDLVEPAPGSLLVAAGDRSLELHVCHSLERELEVLQQRLLALLAADPTLGPGDIWVALPQLDAAAPLIDAVFGAARGNQTLPYAITGRSRHATDERARTLLALLDLAASRCPASAVLGLLESPLLLPSLGLDGDSARVAVVALQAAGLHWGLDDAHLARHGAPPHGGTLADALERLALGSCLPGAASIDNALQAAQVAALQSPSHPALPWPAALRGGQAGLALPGGQAGLDLVGALWRWSEALKALSQQLAQPRHAHAWFEWLDGVLHERLATPADELDRAAQQDLRQRLAAVALAARRALGDAADPAQPGVPLPWAVWRAAVLAALDDPARGGVASGAITFSALAPLRGLPFRVVALLGLDDGVFPAAARAREHDLLASFPERGDRQRRLDDRALFLDAVLAARQTLHLSHSGRSALDNSPRPPSVVVADLLELLVPAICAQPDDAVALATARARLVVEHPLQAFDIAAYDSAADPRLRSSEPSGFDAWQRRLSAASGAPPAPPGAALRRLDTAENAEGQGSEGDDHDNGDPADVDPDAASAAAEAMRQDRDAPPFVAAPLPAEPAADELDAAELERWLRHPARHWLRSRLGLGLAWNEDESDDDEPLDTADRGLRRRLWQHWLPLLVDASLATLPAAESVWPWLHRQGLAPPGALGRAWLDAQWPALAAFAGVVREALAVSHVGPPTPPQTLRIDLPREAGADRAAGADAASGLPATLVWQAPARAAQRVIWHPHSLKGKRVGPAWLHHLLACAAAGDGSWPAAAVHTRLIGAPDRHSAPDSAPDTAADVLAWPSLPAAEARRHLAALVDLYRQSRGDGGCLLPDTGWVWVRSDGKLGRARGVWQPGPKNPHAEDLDGAWRLLLRGRPDPVDSGEFVPWAEAAFGPAWKAAE
jgi:exodeoxyribonuclease V gamma subunit